MIESLTNDNIGDVVLYKTEFESEGGKIKSFDNERKVAWVVYHCNNNWDGDHWKDYTAECTDYSDLIIL